MGEVRIIVLKLSRFSRGLLWCTDRGLLYVPMCKRGDGKVGGGGEGQSVDALVIPSTSSSVSLSQWAYTTLK